MSFTVSGFTLILCAIEALGHFLSGSSTPGESFKQWVEEYMESWACDSKLVDWLWDAARCGMAHQFSLKRPGLEWDVKGRYEKVDGGYRVQPETFFRDFQDGVDRYFADLAAAEEGSTLRRDFENWFEKAYLSVNP